MGIPRSELQTPWFTPLNDSSSRNSSYITPAPEESVGLYAWNQISEWRAAKKGSTARKIIAEAGYFGCTLVSVVETGVRLPAYWVVCNSTSRLIARGISLIKKDALNSYDGVKEDCKDSFDKCLQAVAQNTTSLATNLIGHETNMQTAHTIKNTMEDLNIGQVVITATGIISPGTIISAAVCRKPPDFTSDFINNTNWEK